MAQASNVVSCKRPIMGSNASPFEPQTFAFEAYKAKNEEIIQGFKKRIAKASKMTQRSYNKLAAQVKSAWAQHCYDVQTKQLQCGWINLPGYTEFVNKASQMYHDLAEELNNKAKAAGLRTIVLKPTK